MNPDTAPSVVAKIAPPIFELDSNIRYVAVNQGGKIVEMHQNPNWPSYNPSETDRMEELLVNPTIIELTRRRGDLDLEGIRFIAIRYGLQYQLIFPYREGHVSVGVELSGDISLIASKITAFLDAHV